jgi:hypothetical protein
MRLIPYKAKCDNCGYKSEVIYEDEELSSLWKHQDSREYYPLSLTQTYIMKLDFCSTKCLDEYNETHNRGE